MNWGQAKGAWSASSTRLRAFDPGQLAGGPVAGDLAQLHPDQVVVGVMQALDDVLKDLEADLLAVEIDSRPVADHDGRLFRGR